LIKLSEAVRSIKVSINSQNKDLENTENGPSMNQRRSILMNRSSKNASGNFTNKDLNDSPFQKNMNGRDSNFLV
jgi:hypothetical protein